MFLDLLFQTSFDLIAMLGETASRHTDANRVFKSCGSGLLSLSNFWQIFWSESLVHVVHDFLHPSNTASVCSGVILPTTSSSMMAAGAKLHDPRHLAVKSEISPSSVVSLAAMS